MSSFYVSVSIFSVILSVYYFKTLISVTTYIPNIIEYNSNIKQMTYIFELAIVNYQKNRKTLYEWSPYVEPKRDYEIAKNTKDEMVILKEVIRMVTVTGKCFWNAKFIHLWEKLLTIYFVLISIQWWHF